MILQICVPILSQKNSMANKMTLHLNIKYIEENLTKQSSVLEISF